MNKINRRQWLRFAGLAGAATLIGNKAAHSQQIISPEPGEAINKGIGELIRLSSNENPYGPSQKVRTAMIKGFKHVCRYPNAFQDTVLDLLAAKHKISKDHILLTAGSTEGLKVAGLTYTAKGSEIVAANPVFQSLLKYAETQGAYVHRVPLDNKLTHDLSAMKARITNKTSLVYICNPNNPTGTLLNNTQLQKFSTEVSKTSVIFVDEAYYDYITASDYISSIRLVKKGYNIIVARTFSKVYGLAGLRIGYLIARPDIIERMNKNVMARPNMLALYAAEAALNDKIFYAESLKKNAEGKAYIYNILKELKLEYAPSHGNFVFFKTGKDIQEINTAFMKEGIKVGRPFPPLLDWCRLSIGKTEEMQKAGEAIKKIFV